MTERLLHATTSLCRSCKAAIPASVVALATNEVIMRKACPQHGAQEVRLSTNAAWYEQTRAIKQRFAPPRVIKNAVERAPERLRHDGAHGLVDVGVRVASEIGCECGLGHCLVSSSSIQCTTRSSGLRPRAGAAPVG